MRKYDFPMMKTAFIFSEQSHALKLKVGAVLSKEGRILVTGYNGTISGQRNLCEDCSIIIPEISNEPFNLETSLKNFISVNTDGTLALFFRQDGINPVKLLTLLDKAFRLLFKEKEISLLESLPIIDEFTPKDIDKTVSILMRLFESDKLSYKGSYITNLKTRPYVLHAEQNVIAYAARNGISTDGATLYITHSPCKECAKLIAQSGIKEVVYSKEYRDTDGIDFLRDSNVNVRSL